MIVKLESTEKIKGAVIGVIDVTILEDGPQSVGKAQFVGDDYYKELQSRGIRSPSKLRGKIFM